MKTNRKSLQNWGSPILFLACLFGLSLTASYFYISNQRYYLREKSEQIAGGIALDLEMVILNRINLLKILSRHALNEKSEAFEDTAASLIESYPGTYAINRVRSDGMIVKVIPFESNRAALHQNLLKRNDVKDYLIEARDTQEPTMSHQLITYQKVPAFTLYLPLYNGRTFNGWLNAVIDFDSWIKQFIQYRKLQNTRIIIKWSKPESGTIDIGAPSAIPKFKYKYEILNQDLEINVGFSSAYSDITKKRYDIMLMFVGILLLCIAMIMIIKLNISKMNLREINESLALKNNLLSSLSHDLATPLTSLTIQLERICREKKEELKESTRPQIQNVARLLGVMTDMLKGARLLHAQDIGVMEIPTTPVNLLTATEDAIALVAVLADEKNIHFNILPNIAHKQVLSHNATLVNNVLLNVLTNAIKFTPRFSTLKIYAEEKENEIFLIVEDEGAGLNMAQLENFKNLNFTPSTSGTNQESGTGLGLLQIHGFMKAYNGRVELENIRPKGCRLTLIFKSAN